MSEEIVQIYYVVGIIVMVVSSVVAPVIWINKRFNKFEENHSVKAEDMRDRLIVLESTKEHHNRRLDDLSSTTKSIWSSVSQIKDSISKNHSELLLAIKGAG